MDNTGYTQTALSFLNVKETALYFDHVIPINMKVTIALGIDKPLYNLSPKSVSDYWPPTLFAQLLPPNLLSNSDFEKIWIEANESNYYLTLKALMIQDGQLYALEQLSDEQNRKVEESSTEATKKLIAINGLEGCSIDMPGLFLSKDESSENLTVTLASLNLIDAWNADWEQILEFRKNEESRKKLRRLRLFAFENYAGKPRAYIEDDLHQRLEDYQVAVKEWGFNTRTCAITYFLNSKLMAGALTGTLVSTLVGQPITAIASLVGGTAIEIAGVLIKIKRQKFVLEELVRTHPVSFIDDMKTTLTHSRDSAYFTINNKKKA